MGFHTFDADRADRLEDPSRFRYCSREELVGALQPDSADTLLDLGSGTGFYTDELAPLVGRVIAVDLQREMHDQYREKGVPDNVTLTTADAESLPLKAGTVDGVVSTMTFHESTTEVSLEEIRRVLASGGRFVVVDWSAAGRGESGPPLGERFDATEARQTLSDAGFTVESAVERTETFAVVARA